MSERRAKVLSAIFLLIVISTILKTLQYFGYDSEPDRTRGLKYQLEKENQLYCDQLTDQIVRKVVK